MIFFNIHSTGHYAGVTQLSQHRLFLYEIISIKMGLSQAFTTTIMEIDFPHAVHATTLLALRGHKIAKINKSPHASAQSSSSNMPPQ